MKTKTVKTVKKDGTRDQVDILNMKKKKRERKRREKEKELIIS